jgi:Uma2 family endonuclease
MPPMSANPAHHMFTVDEYQEMGRVGLFPPSLRLELVDGEVFETAPIGRRHAGVLNQLAEIFFRGVGDAAIVCVQNPVDLSQVSELQPDLALLRRRHDYYRGGHPTPEDVLLLVEVADSSAAWDRGVKARLYAAAGIAELWIVDLARGLIEVGTEPGPDGYRAVRQVRPGEPLSPTAFGDLSIPTMELLG